MNKRTQAPSAQKNAMARRILTIGAIAVAKAMIPSMERKVILNGCTNGQNIFNQVAGTVFSQRSFWTGV